MRVKGRNERGTSRKTFEIRRKKFGTGGENGKWRDTKETRSDSSEDELGERRIDA